MKQLAVKIGLTDKKIYQHAEVAALLRAGDKKVHRITVQRFDSQGNPKLANPCLICQEAIKLYGVQVLEYTQESPELARVSLK